MGVSYLDKGEFPLIIIVNRSAHSIESNLLTSLIYSTQKYTLYTLSLKFHGKLFVRHVLASLRLH